MRVISVVPSLGEESSGPSYSVPALCRGLSNAECAVSLHFTGDMPKTQFKYPAFAYPVSIWPHPKLARSPKMISALKYVCKTADIIHNNSFWMYPNIYADLARRGTKCKLVNAPRGTLAEWSLKHHWIQKKLFGCYAQYSAMNSTDMWHATCEKEYEEIRAAGYMQPVAIVPIGIDLPNEVVSSEALVAHHRERTRKLAFFGRLHKVKAVDNLVLAWGKIAERFVEWELLIAGPDAGVRSELESIIAERHMPRVSFVGEIKGREKYEFLASADLCVLPSHTENFGITVAEALACGTPVIASKGTPWSGVEKNGCGWWVDIGIEPLVNKLEESMMLSRDELSDMGLRGRHWMLRDFDWNAIGRKMKSAYQWLLNPEGIEKPDCVVIT